MTKSELIRSLSEVHQIPLHRARLVVDEIFEIISRNLLCGDKVEIRGFGVFSLRVGKARLTRNPQTGAAIEIGVRRGVAFRAGRGLRARLNPQT